MKSISKFQLHFLPEIEEIPKIHMGPQKTQKAKFEQKEQNRRYQTY